MKRKIDADKLHNLLSAISETGRTDLAQSAWDEAFPLAEQEPDITKCPGCGGESNGNDRCVPPNPYYCDKCAGRGIERPTTPLDRIATVLGPPDEIGERPKFGRTIPQPPTARVSDEEMWGAYFDKHGKHDISVTGLRAVRDLFEERGKVKVDAAFLKWLSQAESILEIAYKLRDAGIEVADV